jgi:hypothetical protein
MGPPRYQWLMKETIDALAARMKSDGYRPSVHSTLEKPMLTFHYHETDGKVCTIEEPTRNYILEQARLCPWVLPPEEEEPPEGQGPPSGPPGNDPGNPKEANDPNKILKKLKHVLLSQPRALRHMTECVHYDFAWKSY